MFDVVVKTASVSGIEKVSRGQRRKLGPDLLYYSEEFGFLIVQSK